MVTVRPLHPSDRKAVLEVARALALWFRPLDQMALVIDLMRHEGFVAEEGEQVVGVVTFHQPTPDQAQLSWLGVRPEWHGQGVGSRLLGAVERALRQRGVRFLRVMTVDEQVPEPAFALTRHFYERHRFRAVGREPDAFGQGRHGVVLEKTLV